MSKQPLRYFVELGGTTFPVRDLRGEEGMSRTFRFEASFVLDDPASDLDPDDVVKTPAALLLQREGVVRRIEGLVTEVTLGAAIRGAPEVTLVLEPRLSLLRHRRDIRLFRDQSVPEMVRDVVSALGVKIELRLRDSYEKRPYCVQWRETDLDYVHRLLEDEGIFYYITDEDVMVLGDRPAAYQPIDGPPRLPFRAGMGMDQNEDAIVAIGSRAALIPGKVTLRDWYPEHPSLDMDVSAPSPVPIGPEWYDFPGEYIQPAAGARKAKLTSEAFACEAAAAVGRSTTARIRPGSTFKLEGSPGGKDGDYVVTALRHSMRRAEEGFSNDFEALSESVTFRPPRRTHVPRLTNPLTAFVTTNGQDIQTDAYGRVKIHFHWDRLWPHDDTSSHWVPVVQDNTGRSSAIPRRGWEVLVHFLEGDPDRPVLLGRVYNDEDPFPEKLPAAKTRSSLKSLSSPGRLGTNEIRFEDAAGAEHIFVHAQRDQTVNIANNRAERVGNFAATVVKNDEKVSVGSNRKVKVGEDLRQTVQGNQTYSVSGDRTVKVGLGSSEDVGGDRDLSVGGNHEREIGYDDSIASKTLDEQIGGSVIEKYKTGSRTQSGEQMELTVGGSVLEVAQQSKVESTSADRTEKVGGMIFTKTEGELKIRVNKTRETKVGGALAIKAEKDLTLTGAEKIRATMPTATLDGTSDVTLKVGDTEILLKGGLIKVKAKDTISMLVSGTNTQGSGKSTQI